MDTTASTPTTSTTSDKTWTTLVLDDIDATGIPAPWQDFGQALSRHGAISTSIVQAVADFRETPNEENANLVTSLYGKLFHNLDEAISIIEKTMLEFDGNGTWRELDNTLKAMDMTEMYQALSPALARHPFPVVLESLKFNWRYMSENGTRAFYTMTIDYLERIKQNATEAANLFALEVDGGTRSHAWLILDDLRNIEVPTHCDVCRLSIVPVLVAMKLGIFAS